MPRLVLTVHQQWVPGATHTLCQGPTRADQPCPMSCWLAWGLEKLSDRYLSQPEEPRSNHLPGHRRERSVSSQRKLPSPSLLPVTVYQGARVGSLPPKHYLLCTSPVSRCHGNILSPLHSPLHPAGSLTVQSPELAPLPQPDSPPPS